MDGLIYTDTRPRARSTGHAFGFEGNLGMVIIVATLVSVAFLTALLNGARQLPLAAQLLFGFSPTLVAFTYIILLKARKPPRYDLDLLASIVNGRAFAPAIFQPVHPLLTHHVQFSHQRR